MSLVATGEVPRAFVGVLLLEFALIWTKLAQGRNAEIVMSSAQLFACILGNATAAGQQLFVPLFCNK